ncbi:sensor histidine kinase [Lacticigenium naphthae]|uniref:sensor histidine kinase n=1 Tax=Lacticigenium naphthae TaxID=515351 RepID=UPI000421AEA3|nr:ATP-binding protein [Lacticigenium naphthae]
MKLNIVAIRVWLFTIGLTLFSFLATTFIYGYFYSDQVENNYLTDFEKLISEVEFIAESRTNMLVDVLPDLDLVNSKIFYTYALLDEKEENVLAGIELLPEAIRGNILSNNMLVEAVASNEGFSLRGELENQEGDAIPFLFKGKEFTYENQEAILYSYADLTFLHQIETTMMWILVSLVFFYGLLVLFFYHYLRRKLSEPINVMTNIAFDYSKNDFSKQVPIQGRDDLAALGMAMNKMGHSLEMQGTAVRQEKELLSTILNNIQPGLLYFDVEKTLLLSNPTGDLFLTDYQTIKKDEIRNDEDILYDQMNIVIEKKESKKLDIAVNDYYFSVNIVPLVNEDTQEVRGVVVSSQDLTKEHQLDQMRIDFINNISHELRTPLVMVQGYSEAIIDDVAETREEKHEMATIIRDEAQRMNRLVNEMLDLSRMEAGFIDVHKEWIETSPYIMKLLARFNKMAKEKNVVLDYQIDPEINEIYMDPDKMDQVFVNLINNAIRHTAKAENQSGHVSLIVEAGMVTDELLITIKDNGTGIPKEDIPFIFERFYKADKARINNAENRSGTGIGLSLVKNIVEAHDGTIEVKSDLNKGSSFIIHLPLGEKE